MEPDLVELIARRVVELLREAPAGAVDAGAGGPVLWTTGRVAAELGFSAEWVRDHRAELERAEALAHVDVLAAVLSA